MNPQPQLVDDVDVDAVAAAVRGCPGVEDLAEGPAGSVVTYLPGRRVPGIRIRPDAVTVQVRASWGAVVAALAPGIRSSVAPLVGSRRVDIVVAEIGDPPG